MSFRLVEHPVSGQTLKAPLHALRSIEEVFENETVSNSQVMGVRVVVIGL